MRFSDIDVSWRITLPDYLAGLIDVGGSFTIRNIDRVTGAVDIDTGIGQSGNLFWSFKAFASGEPSICKWLVTDDTKKPIRMGSFEVPEGLTHEQHMELLKQKAGL